jgi:hypothetical protein
MICTNNTKKLRGHNSEFEAFFTNQKWNSLCGGDVHLFGNLVSATTRVPGFYENQCLGSHILLKGLSELVQVSSIYFNRFR